MKHSVKYLCLKLEALTGKKVTLNPHAKYAEEKFEAKLRVGKIGTLFHATEAGAAESILSDKHILTPNIRLKADIGNPDRPQPWWYDNEFGEPQPFYGDFIYAAPILRNHYGVSDPDIVFEIDGDQIPNEVYQAPPNMEGGVNLIKGKVPLKFIKRVLINTACIDPRDQERIEPLLTKLKIPFTHIQW